MSFSITAAGRKADVIRQIRSHHRPEEGGLVHDVRHMIVTALESAKPELGSIDPAGDWGYFIEASGHHDAWSPLSLNISVRAFWLPPEVRDVVDVAPGLMEVIPEQASRADATDLGIGI